MGPSIYTTSTSRCRSRVDAAKRDIDATATDDDCQLGLEYNLRPRSVRNSSSSSASSSNRNCASTVRSKKVPKPKLRPPPLSKYRRKTANARERSRMTEINQAFEELRRAVPQLPVDQPEDSKLTKITTLRLAMNYIKALSQMLQEQQEEEDDREEKASGGGEEECDTIDIETSSSSSYSSSSSKNIAKIVVASSTPISELATTPATSTLRNDDEVHSSSSDCCLQVVDEGLLLLDDPAAVLSDVLDPLTAALSEDSNSLGSVDPMSVDDFAVSFLASPVSDFDALLETDADGSLNPFISEHN